MRQQIEEGMGIYIDVDLRSFPKKLLHDVTSIYRGSPSFTLRITNTTTGERLVLPSHHRWSPPGRPSVRDKERIPLDGTLVHAWSCSFLPVTVRVPVKPGHYECNVAFSQRSIRLRIGTGRAREYSHKLGFWTGTIRSGDCSFEIVEATPKTATFRVPSRLRLVHQPRFRWPSILFTNGDTEEVTVPRRNGFVLGTRVYRDGDRILQSGPTPRPDQAIDRLSWYKGGPLSATYRITVFESSTPGGHRWMPEQVKVLWEREFPVSWTAEEVENNRRKHEESGGE